MSKLYYSSSEVSSMLELEPSVIRFWEDQFSQLRIKRNRAGKRMYREKDIELIRTIKQLTRDEGYTIAGARKRLQEFAAERSVQKADPGAANAGPGVANAGPGAAKPDNDGKPADPGVMQADSGPSKPAASDEAGPGAVKAADSGPASETASSTAPDPEIIKWIRSNLVDLRKSMD